MAQKTFRPTSEKVLDFAAKILGEDKDAVKAKLSPVGHFILDFNSQYDLWQNNIRELAICQGKNPKDLFKAVGSISDERSLWFLLSHLFLLRNDFGLALLQRDAAKVVPDISDRSTLRKINIAEQLGLLELALVNGLKKRRYQLTALGHEYLFQYLEQNITFIRNNSTAISEIESLRHLSKLSTE